jgi:hypothetical protein
MVARRRHKGLHQRGLAQSRLARDEAHLADATERRGKPGVEAGQFRLPPDRRDSTVHCRRRTARGMSGQG